MDTLASILKNGGYITYNLKQLTQGSVSVRTCLYTIDSIILICASKVMAKEGARKWHSAIWILHIGPLLCYARL